MAGLWVATLGMLAVLASGLKLHTEWSLPRWHNQEPEEHLADPWEGSFPARGNISRPRMLAMRGCSGSSAIMVYARDLLRYHGIPVPMPAEPRVLDGNPVAPLDGHGWPAELLKPEINWFFQEAGQDMGKAMLLANEKCQSTNQTLFFKGMVQQLGHVTDFKPVEDSFKQMQLNVVLGSRKNMLDQVVCQIRDCFQEDYGYPVDNNGEASDLCFSRRGNLSIGRNITANESDSNSTTGDYMAHVEPMHLINHIDREYDYVEKASRNLLHAGLTFEKVYEEDLLDFQTTIPGALARGVVAWSSLLRSFGVEPKLSLIRTYLKQYAGTYPPPAPHKDLIHNIDIIEGILKGHEYYKLIRK